MGRGPGYSVLEGSVREGWQDYLYRQRFEQPFSKDFECRTCQITALCGRCPGFADMENGDPESVVDYMCQVAHLRARKFLYNR
jgi:radical SAM protein with 4Fe4S-binding SPASM domain